MNPAQRLSIAAVVLLFATPGTATSSSASKDLVRVAIVQMGGENALRNLKTVRFKAMGHRNMVEESERPEGPYIVEYHEIAELRDFDHDRFQQTDSARVLGFGGNQITTTVADGVAFRQMNGHARPGSRRQIQDADENLELGPERILLTALAAPDLHMEPDMVLQSMPNHVLAFTWKDRPVHIFLNSYTSLPTAVEWTCAYPDDMFWSVWGDVTTRVYYSAWWLTQAGIHYPLQWDFYRNNLPDHVLTITTLEPNVDLRADAFALSPEIKSAFEKNASLSLEDRATNQGAPGQAAVELSKDVILIPGAWNVTLVRQPDGVVVLEAPISSGYSVKMIGEASRRWPGVPIKAVISTSDSWPHFAGLREYVARGIPVYALDLNVAILSRLLSAPHTIIPDSLAQSPKNPNFRLVSGKTALGDGPNRLEIYPLRGETSERQMMVYFPEHKLLYGSDPFQKNDDGTYTFPQTVWELMHAVEREKLPVDTFFMMHVGATPWIDLSKVVQNAEASKNAN